MNVSWRTLCNEHLAIAKMVDVVSRARELYGAAEFREHGRWDEPSAAESGLVVVDEKLYAKLGNSGHVFAVYRVRPCGRLRRLKRWPAAAERV